MDEPKKERRRHLRIYHNFILTYHEKDQSIAKHNVSQINNLSQGGVNFLSTHPIELGAVVVIDLKTPFIVDSVHIEGVVLESKEKITDMIYEVRLQFQNITEEALTVLKKIESYASA